MLLERPTFLDSKKIKTFIIKSKSRDFITFAIVHVFIFRTKYRFDSYGYAIMSRKSR